MRPSLGLFLLACAAIATGCIRQGDCEDGHRLFGGRCLDLGAAVTTHWGFAPETLRIADLDADGAPDLVAASHGTGAVSVVWGGKGMSSGTATTWSVATAVDGLAVVDLDLDGRLDLVTAVPDADALAVLHNRGQRELDPPVLHPTALPAPTGPQAFDLDGDGPPELVAIHRAEGTLTVLRDLQPHAAIAVGAGPVGLAGGDLDGDGDLDLAVALSEAAAVQVLLGDGTGGLERGPRHAVGVAPFAVVAADFDADGALDLATADALADSVSVLFGDGTGRLRTRSVWPTDPDPRALAVVADSDNGHVLYVLSYQTSTMQRLDPRRGVDLVGATRQRVDTFAGGDLDGDGRDELVYASRSSRELGRLDPAPGLVLTPRWQTGRARLAFPLDLDDDGHDDIAIVPAPTEDAVVSAAKPVILQLWRDDASAFTEIPLGPLFTVERVLVAELDGEPDPELLAFGGGMLLVLTLKGDAWIAGEPAYFNGLDDVGLVDRDGDGRHELLLRSNFFHDNTARLDHVALADDGSFEDIASYEFDGWLGAAAGVDHEGDGDQAVLVIARNQLHVIDDGSEPRPLVLDGVLAVTEFALADLDGDQRVDAILCASAGMLRVDDILAETPAEPQRIDRGGCSQLDLHDFDGDERLDILAQQGDGSGGSARAVLTPWLRSDDGWTRLASQSLPASVLGTRLVRLDDDSWLDLLVDVPDQPARVYDMSFGTSIASAPLFTGDLGSSYVDLDGDGVLDFLGLGRGLAVARGDGDGGFGPLQHRSLEAVLPGADQISSAAIDDLDHDGDAELLIVAQRAEGWRSDLHFLELERAAVPTAAPLLELPRVNTRITLADFDGDRVLDLLAHAGGPDPQYTVLRGDGHGEFADPTWTSLALAGATTTLRPIDLDGDGRLDLLETRPDGLMVHHGLGDARFAQPQLWSRVSVGNFAGFADLDRDGQRDLAMLSSTGLIVLHGQADGRARRPQMLFEEANAGVIVDLDRDGQLEVLAGTADALHIGRREPDGRLLFTHHDLELPGLAGFVTADFDGDGLLDLGLRSSAGITIARQRP